MSLRSTLFAIADMSLENIFYLGMMLPVVVVVAVLFMMNMDASKDEDDVS